MAITMEKGGERRQWCRGVWEREKCPNPQTHSHTHREISRISCFKRLLGSPMHRLLAGEHFRPAQLLLPWGNLDKDEPHPLLEMPAQIRALGCHKATKDPGEEDEGTICSFAEGKVFNFLFFSCNTSCV